MNKRLDDMFEIRYLRGAFCNVMSLFVEKAQERFANDSPINGVPDGQTKFTLNSAQK